MYLYNLFLTDKHTISTDLKSISFASFRYEILSLSDSFRLPSVFPHASCASKRFKVLTTEFARLRKIYCSLLRVAEPFGKYLFVLIYSDVQTARFQLLIHPIPVERHVGVNTWRVALAAADAPRNDAHLHPLARMPRERAY